MRVGKQAKGQGAETGLPRGSNAVGNPGQEMGQRPDQKWNRGLPQNESKPPTKNGAKV